MSTIKKTEGRKYRVARLESAEDGAFYSIGDMLVLTYDDGSSIPRFDNLTTGKTSIWVRFSNLEYYDETLEEKVARLELELAAVKIERAPWAQYKEGDRVRIQEDVTVLDVEPAEYDGSIVIKVEFATGESIWINNAFLTNSKKL